MITIDADSFGALCTSVAALNVPVALELVETSVRGVSKATVVIHGPRDLNTPTEVKVLRLVCNCTDDFRWCADQ